MTSLTLSRAALALLIAGAAVLIGAIFEGAPASAAIGVIAGAGALVALFAGTRALPAEPVETGPPPRPALDELIAALGDPVLVLEGQLVRRANRAAETLLGYHVVDQDVRLAIRHPVAAAALTGPLDTGVTVELNDLGGRDRRWEMIVQPLGPGARLVRLVDRSAGHAAEKMRVDFVANASHELRTPLATLLGFIETLGDASAVEDPATRNRFLAIMAGEARRMQRLIDDLISLSRIEAERHSAPKDAVDLAPLIAETAASFVDADIRIEDAGVSAVIGDRPQLSQVLHNLIGNATKYGRAGTPVRVTLDRTDNMVRLQVIDQGDGVAPEHLPRLTERFYRADASRSRALGGTGLGLAIVKHIVERHRGRLAIASEIGTGTTVTILLPPAVTKESR